jgi:hypothetical protein
MPRRSSLLARAQDAGAARGDIEVGEAMAILRGVTSLPVDSGAQRQRLVGVAIDALRTPTRR